MIYKYNNKTYVFEGEKDIMKFIKILQKSPKQAILDKDRLIKSVCDEEIIKRFKNRKFL